MGMTNHKILSFVKYKTIDNWSVSHIVGNKMWFNDLYPMVSIGDIIEKATNTIEIQDEAQYKQVTLKTNGGGAVLRDVKYGREIGTKKQYVVSEGQFIMSKIDARNGAFGVITKELDGAIVTADFPVFNVNTEIVLPQYLFLLSSSKCFAQFAQSCSRGTTNRQRIDVGLFLSQQIPLPPLSEQHRLFNEFEANMQQATDNERQAAEIERDIEKYLLDELGIISKDNSSNNLDSKQSFVRFIRYKNIEKWGYDFIHNNDNVIVETKYKNKRISQLCSISSGGTPSRNRNDYYNGTIPWIKTGELNNEVILDTEEKITQLGLVNSSAKLYPKDSIAIAMYGATIGKTAKFGIDATTNQACAVLFNIDTKTILTDYLWIYLQYQTDNLKAMAYGGAQPNINAGIVANYKIPIPPFSVQHDIVKNINTQKVQIKQLQQAANNLRETAMKEFENEIFDNKNGSNYGKTTK